MYTLFYEHIWEIGPTDFKIYEVKHWHLIIDRDVVYH
jgi:hypothetical protein